MSLISFRCDFHPFTVIWESTERKRALFCSDCWKFHSERKLKDYELRAFIKSYFSISFKFSRFNNEGWNSFRWKSWFEKIFFSFFRWLSFYRKGTQSEFILVEVDQLAVKKPLNLLHSAATRAALKRSNSRSRIETMGEATFVPKASFTSCTSCASPKIS